MPANRAWCGRFPPAARLGLRCSCGTRERTCARDCIRLATALGCSRPTVAYQLTEAISAIASASRTNRCTEKKPPSMVAHNTRTSMRRAPLM